jgi:hypothetical protein
MPGGVHRAMVAVVAGEPLLADSGYTHETEVEVPRPGMHSVFYEVPEGAQLLRIDLNAPDRAVGIAVAEPDTRGVQGIGGPGSTGRTTHFVERPRAGVWEIRLSDTRDLQEWDWEQARDEEPVPPTPATLTVSAIGVGVAGGALASDNDGSARSGAVTATNRLAEFTGGIASLPLGAARKEQRRIGPREQHVLEIEVPEGSTGLMVQVGGFAESEADLDVYLHDCSGNHCSRAGTGANLRGEEFIHVDTPDAGTWKVVVDAFHVPEGGIGYDYLDVVFNPTFGSVAAADVPVERERDASWEVRTHQWETGDLPEGREPYAAFRLDVQIRDAETRGFTLGELLGG